MSAGVYLLWHRPKQCFYIGQSMRLEDRRRRWFSLLVQFSGCDDPSVWFRSVRSWRFADAASGTRLDDWSWRVIEPLDGAPPGYVRAAERRHISQAMREHPDLCLNSYVAPERFFTAVQYGRVADRRAAGSARS